MSRVDQLAKQLVTLHGGQEPRPDSFDALHRIVFSLRHAPLSTLAGIQAHPDLSDLPTKEAKLLFEFVRTAGPDYASTALFIEISNALEGT